MSAAQGSSTPKAAAASAAQASAGPPEPAAEPREPALRRALGTLLVVAFLVALVTPGLVSLLDDGALKRARSAVLKENRKPVDFPAAPATLAQLDSWPRAFESWWNDHFGLRTSLIRWHNMAKLLGFGVEPGDQVLLGGDAEQPWLFVSLNKPVLDYRGLLPFDEAELRHWQRFLEQRRDWLAERDCRYVFVVAPNKSSVYPEFMPAAQTRVGAATRLDQLVAWMSQHSDVPLLDMRPALLAAKAEGFAGVAPDSPLYYPLGTHWNGLGAWVGYRALLQRVGPWFAWQPHPLEVYKTVQHVGQGDTWARRFHMEDLLPQPFTTLHWIGPPWVEKTAMEGEHRSVVVFKTKQRDAPVGVLLRDSFGNSLGPHLAPHFKRLYMVWNQVDGPAKTLAVLKNAGPQLVIEEVVERYLVGDLPPLLPLDDGTPPPRGARRRAAAPADDDGR